MATWQRRSIERRQISRRGRSESNMGFPGGKAGAGTYQKIINQIPPHDVYIEPFLGGGAIMERKRPARRSIGIEIDLDTAAATARRLNPVIPNLAVCRGSAFDWLRTWFGMNAYELVRGRACFIRSADAALWIDQRSTFVYIDPPYLMSTRLSGSLYKNELTMPQHVELLGIVTRLPCMVAISGYWSPLYSKTLEKWRHISFNAQTRGGRRAREFVWMNYPEPTALHDYRYLGNNKRQRERIARKVRTWTAGLARLPRLERQAIMASLEIPAK